MNYSGKIFFDQLQAAFPSISMRLTDFSTGGFLIDVSIGSETHVVEYLPKLGLGVSRVNTATFGWEGVENEFASFEQVEQYLNGIVKERK